MRSGGGASRTTMVAASAAGRATQVEAAIIAAARRRVFIVLLHVEFFGASILRWTPRLAHRPRPRAVVGSVRQRCPTPRAAGVLIGGAAFPMPDRIARRRQAA